MLRSKARFSHKAQSSLSQFGGVHGSRGGVTKQWRNKPLLRRDGDVRFKTGTEAAELLLGEASRRDVHLTNFLQTFGNTLNALTPVFDRNPKYAWVAKQLIEPERFLQFRVAWLDDEGTLRMNRGFRVQYSSTLGPYEGGLHFGSHINTDTVKAMAFDTLISNALSGMDIGAAVGGADFDPEAKSEAEIQRFCQSYMTELSKYIGPDIDMPSIGFGVSGPEIGYLYGQYKRINQEGARKGRGLLWGGHVEPPVLAASGRGVAMFADMMLKDKGQDLAGKRCLITGSGVTAIRMAEKLLELGAIPITFSDSSGYIYEEDGIDMAKLATIKKITAERGSRIGRYIVASTTAKFEGVGEGFGSIFDIPCDYVFPCALSNELSVEDAAKLADNGCKAIIEATNMPVTVPAIAEFKKRGLLHAPYKATLAAGTISNGAEMEIAKFAGIEDLDRRLEEKVNHVYNKVKDTAGEFNTRGDLARGTNIAGFLKVANIMMQHGAV